MRKRSRSLIIGVAVLLGTLALSLLAIETAFRVFWPQENLYIYELRQDFLFHRAGFSGWTSTIPKFSWNELQRFLQKQPPAGEGPFKARLRFDGNGFLADEETPLAKKPGRKRVLVLGDSISLGWPEGFDGGYVGDLKKRLPHVDFLNCSMIGVNTAGLADIHEKHCGRFEADLVLLQITVSGAHTIPDYFWADFAGPSARLEDATWQKTATSVATLRRPPLTWRDFVVQVDLSNPEIRDRVENIYRPYLPLYDDLHLVRLIENSFFLDPLSHSPLINEVSDLINDPHWRSEILRSLSRGDHPTLHAVGKIKRTAARKQQPVLALVVPNRFGVLSSRSTHADYAPILDGIRKLDVKVVDLGTELQGLPIDDSYWKDDPHPNRSGYRWIANRVEKDLAALLEPRR